MTGNAMKELMDSDPNAYDKALQVLKLLQYHPN